MIESRFSYQALLAEYGGRSVDRLVCQYLTISNCFRERQISHILNPDGRKTMKMGISLSYLHSLKKIETKQKPLLVKLFWQWFPSRIIINLGYMNGVGTKHVCKICPI